MAFPSPPADGLFSADVRVPAVPGYRGEVRPGLLAELRERQGRALTAQSAQTSKHMALQEDYDALQLKLEALTQQHTSVLTRVDELLPGHNLLELGLFEDNTGTLVSGEGNDSVIAVQAIRPSSTNHFTMCWGCVEYTNNGTTVDPKTTSSSSFSRPLRTQI